MYQRKHERSSRAAVKGYRFVRLPGEVEPEPLAAELRAASPTWTPSQWKWHLGTDFLVLRGGPPGPYPASELVTGTGRDLPILSSLPRIRDFLDTAFPVPATVAWVGSSPPGAWIHLHVDNTKHWDEHHRVHVPLVTSPGARLCVEGRFQHLVAGAMWALDNSRPHGAINDGPERWHLVVDLPPAPEVEAWIAAGEVVEGERDPEAFAKLCRDPFDALTPGQRADADLMARLGRQ
jgi:kumamolisin